MWAMPSRGIPLSIAKIKGQILVTSSELILHAYTSFFNFVSSYIGLYSFTHALLYKPTNYMKTKHHVKLGRNTVSCKFLHPLRVVDLSMFSWRIKHLLALIQWFLLYISACLDTYCNVTNLYQMSKKIRSVVFNYT